MAIRRIGQILVDLGFLREEQLELLLEEQQQRPGEMFGQIAMSMGFINDEQLAQGLAEQMGMQVVSLSDVVIPPDVLTHITEPMAQLYRIIPLSFEDNALTIAMCDPQKLSIIDELRSFLGFDIKAMVCTEKELLKALDRYYSAGGESVETLIADMEQDDELAAAVQAMEKSTTLDLTSVEALADSAPVRKLLNMVLLLAIQRARQRLALRAVRERVQDPHPLRRRAVRDGAAAAAPGLRHHHADQGHGRSGHRRAPLAAGRPHPLDRRRPPGRSCASASCPRCSARAW